MKKLFIAIMLCFYILGTFGALGYSIYDGNYHIAIGVAVTGYLAFFKACEYWNILYNLKKQSQKL